MAYAVTPLRLDAHRDALARLWAENMSDARIASLVPARMRWLYEDGPEGPARTVLAVESGSGEAVGCGSFFERPTWIDGARVRGGVLCDFAVTRAHRIGGAALAIQRALVEAGRGAGLDLLYGYPNEKSLAIFKRVGYRVVGETRTWVKPLRAAYKLRERLPRRLVPLAALPLDLALRAADAARAARLGPRLAGAPLDGPGASTDALWERTRARPGVVGEKSSAYLAWRYARFPTAEHRILAVRAAGDDRLAGYAVYAVAGEKAFLRDLLAEDLDGTAAALLLALAAHLRAGGIQSLSLSYLGPERFERTLRAAGFLLRPGRRPLVLHPDAVPEPLRARAFDPESWFVLDGELDI